MQLNGPDVKTIIDASKETGLVAKESITLLGAQILKGPAVDQALLKKVAELNISVERLSLLHAHNALVLLRN